MLICEMTTALVCSPDRALADIVAWNLERRGYGVRREAWAACCPATGEMPPAEDVIIVDLDCPAPTTWQALARVRERYGDRPVIVLSYEWPDARHLLVLRPGAYHRKPFAIEDLLHSVLVLTATSSPNS